jgi:hypothetical protein
LADDTSGSCTGVCVSDGSGRGIWQAIANFCGSGYFCPITEGSACGMPLADCEDSVKNAETFQCTINPPNAISNFTVLPGCYAVCVNNVWMVTFNNCSTGCPISNGDSCMPPDGQCNGTLEGESYRCEKQMLTVPPEQMPPAK